MKSFKISLAIALVAFGGMAVAKGDRVEPEAQARSEVMRTIGGQMKVFGDMLEGKTEFNADAAAAAKAALIEATAAMPAAYATEGKDDPASEALPAIWTSWDDFTAKTEGLKVAAEGMDTSSIDGLKAGMGAVGATCKDCHTSYRE